MKDIALLQYGALLPSLEAALSERYAVERVPAGPKGLAFLRAHGQRFEAYAASARYGIDAERLDLMPRLRVASIFGVGLDAVDSEAVHARGVTVGYTPAVLTDCVADTAFALLLDVARRTPAADRFVRRGDWLQGSFPLATKVSGKRLGILGLGRIGAAIARRAAGFDMDIAYTNRRAVEGSSWRFESSLPALARWCDFLVVAAAGDAGVLVTAEVLDALGPQGYLVNVARGSVVDETALVQALQQGRLAGAGLDVFAQEPQVPDALRAMDQVVLLPHIASATHETRAAMAQRVLDNLACFFAGQPLPSPIP